LATSCRWRYDRSRALILGNAPTRAAFSGP
jgi:hypothetical protein